MKLLICCLKSLTAYLNSINVYRWYGILVCMDLILSSIERIQPHYWWNISGLLHDKMNRKANIYDLWWISYVHQLMKIKTVLFIIAIFTLIFLFILLENPNINGDGGSSSNQPKLFQVELLDLCLIDRVVVNKPIHISTIEEKIGLIWQPWRK